MIPLVQQTRKTILKQFVILIVITVLLAAGIACWSTPLNGLSVLCGGAVALLGQLLFGRAAFRAAGARQSLLVQANFKRGLIAKWSFTLISTAALLAGTKLPPLPYIAMFCMVVLISASTLLLFSKK